MLVKESLETNQPNITTTLNNTDRAVNHDVSSLRKKLRTVEKLNTKFPETNFHKQGQMGDFSQETFLPPQQHSPFFPMFEIISPRKPLAHALHPTLLLPSPATTLPFPHL